MKATEEVLDVLDGTYLLKVQVETWSRKTSIQEIPPCKKYLRPWGRMTQPRV